MRLNKDFKNYICHTCKSEFHSNKKQDVENKRKNSRNYCSDECKRKYCSECASHRMKVKNPSFLNENILKIRKTKKKNGTLNLPPKPQGGNGKETPETVKKLNSILNWDINHIVRTYTRIYYPSHYKLEIANPGKKICIEIDGQCMYSRKEQISKKEEFLKNQGWNVVRFKNKEVMQDPESCARKVLELCK